MKLIEILTPDFTFTDDRGTLTQIVHEGFTQVNAVFTRAGKIRGNFHYHESTKELFFVIKAKLNLRQNITEFLRIIHFPTAICLWSTKM